VKRTFWFGLGVAVGVAAARKVSGTARRFTPAGIAENLGDAVRELAAALGSFGSDVRAGMAEREAELHATVAARTGIDTSPQHLPAGPGAWVPPTPSQAQARQAGDGPASS